MRKFGLLVLVGAALALAAPQSGSAAPVAPGVIAAAADHVSQVDEARYWRRGGWHRGWHRRWGWRHAGWRWRHRGWWHHRRCWHRRYWSGLRCW